MGLIDYAKQRHQEDEKWREGVIARVKELLPLSRYLHKPKGWITKRCPECRAEVTKKEVNMYTLWECTREACDWEYGEESRSSGD